MLMAHLLHLRPQDQLIVPEALSALPAVDQLRTSKMTLNRTTTLHA